MLERVDLSREAIRLFVLERLDQLRQGLARVAAEPAQAQRGGLARAAIFVLECSGQHCNGELGIASRLAERRRRRLADFVRLVLFEGLRQGFDAVTEFDLGILRLDRQLAQELRGVDPHSFVFVTLESDVDPIQHAAR